MNYTKATDRAMLQKKYTEALEAIRMGTWPRTLNEAFEWNNQNRNITDIEWATRMYTGELEYLRSIETRIQSDPSLAGWES